MDTKTFRVVLDRETTGALLYRELLANDKVAKAPNDPGAIIGTQYIRKAACDGKYPRVIEVTLRPVED